MSTFDTFLEDFLSPLAADGFNHVGSLAAYLQGVPADERSGDEANIVDRQIADRFLKALGYHENEIFYNLQKGNSRPDFAVRLEAGRTNLVVEDKNTTIQNLEANLPQLSGYMLKEGCAVGVLLNGRRLVVYQMAERNANATQRLDLEEAVKCWRGESLFAARGLKGAAALPHDQRETLEAIYLRLRREAFAGLEAMIRELVIDAEGQPHALDGSSWPSRAAITIRHFPAAGPLAQGEESTIEGFVGEVKGILREARLDAASQLKASMLEGEQHDAALAIHPLSGAQFSTELERACDELKVYLGAAGLPKPLIASLNEQVHDIFENEFPQKRREEISQRVLAAVGRVSDNSQRRSAENKVKELAAAVFAVIERYHRHRDVLGHQHAAALTVRKRFLSWKQTTGVVLGANKKLEEQQEEFATQTAYVLFVRFLVLRVAEDKGIISRVFTNGGVAAWFHYVEPRFLARAAGRSAAMLLELAYQSAGYLYPQFYNDQPVFDWFQPDRKLVVRLLRLLAGYDFAHIDDDVIGHLYQGYVGQTHRHETGMYYTPPVVIEMMLDAIDFKGQQVIGKRLLDPACGSGAFLVAACRRVLAAYRHYWSDAGYEPANLPVEQVQAALDEVQNSIHGLELNPFACYLAETNLLIQMFSLIGGLADKQGDLHIKRFSIHNTDTLLAGPETLLRREDLNAYVDLPDAEQIKARLDRFADGFDYVVANPPYVRADENPELLDYRRRVEALYPFLERRTLFKGKWDLFVPFIALGALLLREGGRMAMIVSKGISQPYAQPVRNWLAQRMRVDQVNFFSKVRLFTNVMVENVVFVATAKAPDEHHETLARWHESAPPAPAIREERRNQAKYGGRVLRRQDLPVVYNDTTPLQHICYVSVGMVLNANEKRFPGAFKKDELIGPVRDAKHPKPYVEGKDLEPYLVTSVRWLEYGPKLRAPAKIRRDTVPELYSTPKIMRGETSGAWLDTGGEGGLLANHSVYLLARWVDLERVSLNKALKKSIRQAKLPRLRLEAVSRHFNLHFLLAVLNHPTALAIARANASHNIDSKYEPESLKKIEVPNASYAEQESIGERVRVVLERGRELMRLRSEEGWIVVPKDNFVRARVSTYLAAGSGAQTVGWVRAEQRWGISSKQDALSSKVDEARVYEGGLYRGKRTLLMNLGSLSPQAGEFLCRLLEEQPEGSTLSVARSSVQLPATPEDAERWMEKIYEEEAQALALLQERERELQTLNAALEALYAVRRSAEVAVPEAIFADEEEVDEEAEDSDEEGEDAKDGEQNLQEEKDLGQGAV